jgi:peptide/histidine transporter 3/4
MSEELTASTTDSLRIAYIKSCCKPTYRVSWIKNKGAILIILWNYLVTSVFHFLKTGYDPQQKNNYGISIIAIVSTFIFCPIGGWLADTHIGRYRAVRYSMWIMWIALVLATFSELLAQGSTWYGIHCHLRYAVLYILGLVAAIGFVGFQSNSVQLGITQLSNASTIEITSFITWYVMTFFISNVTIQIATNCTLPDTDTDQYIYVTTFAVALLLTIALVLDFLFHSCLTKEQPTGKPLSLIFNVIKFSVKHRHSFRSEIQCETPSKLNIAKRIYGGPFTSQEVEDVKSMLRIITLIAICSIVCAAIIPVEYATKKIERNLMKWSESKGLTGCYERLSVYYNDYFFTIGIVILYEFIVYPIFHRCLPRLKITNRFLLGIVLFLLRILALIGIEIAVYRTKPNVSKCIFTHGLDSEVNVNYYKWLLLPGLSSGLSTFLFILSAIEFIWAQTPYFMTGLVFGIAYAFLALYVFIHLAIGSPFLFIDRVHWKHYPLTCGIWYFTMQAVIAVVALIVGLIAFKKYKERMRHDSTALSSNLYEDRAINQEPFC